MRSSIAAICSIVTELMTKDGAFVETSCGCDSVDGASGDAHFDATEPIVGPFAFRKKDPNENSRWSFLRYDDASGSSVLSALNWFIFHLRHSSAANFTCDIHMRCLIAQGQKPNEQCAGLCALSDHVTLLIDGTSALRRKNRNRTSQE
jgi:hypothetical protein